MTLDKAIKYGKEHRRTYSQKGKRSADFDRSCRNHGSCKYCLRNRLFHHYRQQQIKDEVAELDELMTYGTMDD